MTTICAHLHPSASLWRVDSKSGYLRSQIYPLRAFSAFGLTADKPQPYRMANMWGNRLSPDVRSHWTHAPGVPRQRRLGSAFSDSPSRAARLVNRRRPVGTF
jgi:hypothetical protein